LYGDEDYPNYPIYSSDTYSLTDVSEYNSVLLNTEYYITHANVQFYTSLTEEKTNFPWNNNPSNVEVAYSKGSGFIFLETDVWYYALTNYHVIDPGDYSPIYWVKAFGDENYYKTEIVAFDEQMDLAVMRFEKLYREDITVIDVTSRLFYQFNPNELVLAVGNPKDLLNNVTFGEFISMESIQNVDFKVIYHNAAIHEGSSGGLLADVDGNFLGINTWGSDTDNPESFAIPNYIVYGFLKNNGILD